MPPELPNLNRLPGATPPVAPPRVSTAPIGPATATGRINTRDRSGVAEVEDPFDKAPGHVDLGALARTAGQLGQALEAAAPLVDAGANSADAVAFAPDALEAAFTRLKPATPQAQAKLGAAVENATKAGRALGAVGAAIACKDLVQACWPKLDMSGAAEALCNLALGLATAGDDLLKTPGANAALRTVGGVAGLASSLFAIARDIQDCRENGLKWTNALGLLGNALTAAGSAMLLMPGMQVVAGAVLMVGASINVTRLAVENWDPIKGHAKAAASRVGGWVGDSVKWATGPPVPAPPPSLA